MTGQRDPAARRAKLRAALAGVTGCPVEWATDDGNVHMCNLLAAVEHTHMCSCAEQITDAQLAAQ